MKPYDHAVFREWDDEIVFRGTRDQCIAWIKSHKKPDRYSLARWFEGRWRYATYLL